MPASHEPTHEPLDTLAARARDRHGGHSRRTNREIREEGVRTPGQHGRMTPDSATHAGCTTATAHATRQPPSPDIHRDTHAGEPHTHARLTRAHTVRTHTHDRQPWLTPHARHASKAEARPPQSQREQSVPCPLCCLQRSRNLRAAELRLLVERSAYSAKKERQHV